MGRLEESLAYHTQVMRNQYNDVRALINYSCALRENSQFDEELEGFEKARTLDPHNLEIEFERSQNLLYNKNYSEGWKAFEDRWHTGELPVKKFNCPQWQGENVL